jgi:hypothetical protein
MDNADPAGLLTACPQVDAPDVGSASRHQQARAPQGLCQMRLVEMDTTAFLVRENGFNANLNYLLQNGLAKCPVEKLPIQQYYILQYLCQLRKAEGRLRGMNTTQAGNLVENLA